MLKGQVYFPGLNGLRFFASVFVLITHLEMFKKLFGYPNVWDNPVVNSFGSIGVDLFFVLSGFLITYLLLVEKKETGNISLKDFFIRRILRIWPLYYLVIALTFFVIPYIPGILYGTSVNEHFGSKLTLYGLMLPNIALAVYPSIHYASMSWSIGVEEQFYIIWPFLIAYSRNVLRHIVVIILAFMALKVFLLVLMKLNIDASFFAGIKEFIVMTRLECMAFGGLGAYLLFFQKKKLLNWIYNPWMQALCFLGVLPVTYLLVWTKLEDAKHWVYSVMFLVVVLNVASNPRVIINIERGWLNKLGKISYGIYMYQYFVIISVTAFLQRFFHPETKNQLLFNILFYGVSITGVIIVSHFSYEYFEKRFIKMKSKFTTILSGDLVNKTNSLVN